MNTDSLNEREEAPERLEQIRQWSRIASDMEETAAKNHLLPGESKTEKRLREDIDFLLFLLDSHMEFAKKFAEKAYVGQYETVNDAATRMRDLCVAKVREYLTDCRDEETGIVEAIATELQSLTLSGRGQ